MAVFTGTKPYREGTSMHPDSTRPGEPRFKTHVTALVRRVNSPYGADLIHIMLWGYYPNGGGENLDLRFETYLNYNAGPASDETRHPDLENMLRETLGMHSLWGKWAQLGRGVSFPINCWQENAGDRWSPITVEFVGHKGVTARVNGPQNANAEHHLGLYIALRNLIREAGKWTQR